MLGVLIAHAHSNYSQEDDTLVMQQALSMTKHHNGARPIFQIDRTPAWQTKRRIS
jgi:hypothetical protein